MTKNCIKIEDFRKAGITVRQILLYLVDFTVAGHEIFDTKGIYRKSIRDYRHWREKDKMRFSQMLYRLKKKQLVKVYKDNNETVIELTSRGYNKAREMAIGDIKIIQPKKWDGRWRIVVFDIPKEDNAARDILRNKLKQLGFLPLQKSVFVYPFECFQEIDFVRRVYSVEKYVQYIIADRIETDEDLVGRFFDSKILNQKLCKSIINK